MSKPKWFGGKGTRQAVGTAATDPIGTVRVSPDGRWLAIQWPSTPSGFSWAVTDRWGSVGYEKSERIAHWPIAGAVPMSPAAGNPLRPHKRPKDTPGRQRAVAVIKAAAQDKVLTRVPERPRGKTMINTPARSEHL